MYEKFLVSLHVNLVQLIYLFIYLFIYFAGVHKKFGSTRTEFPSTERYQMYMEMHLWLLLQLRNVNLNITWVEFSPYQYCTPNDTFESFS